MFNKDFIFIFIFTLTLLFKILFITDTDFIKEVRNDLWAKYYGKNFKHR